MILVDGEKLKYTKTPKPESVEKVLTDAKKKLDAIGWPIVFKLRDDLVKDKGNGQVDRPGQKSLLAKRNVTLEHGQFEIIYCESFKYDEFNNVEFFPTKIKFKHDLIIDESDWEKAVYLYLFNTNNHIEMYNPVEENQEMYDINHLKAEVFGMIYTPVSHKLDEEMVKRIALSYGVIVANKDIKAVQNDLWIHVESAQSRNKDTFNQFKAKVANVALLTINANIRNAENLGKIKAYDGQAQTWGYRKPDDSIGSAIMQYNKVETKYDELATFFVENSDKYDEFIAILGDDAIVAKKAKSKAKS